MTIDINQFWNGLTESQIASPAQIQSLFSESASQCSDSRNPDSVAKWVVKKGLISDYQAEILLAGFSGPFHYGQYQVIDRLSDSEPSCEYLARHRKSGYRVLLRFVPGSTPEDLEYWKRVERRIRKLSRVKSRFLMPVFDAVVLPDHRVIISEIPTGKTVHGLPRKSRLPWQQSCAVAAQVAQALASLHENDLLHGNLSESSVWMKAGGEVRLRLEPWVTEMPFLKRSPEQQLAQQLCLAPEIDLVAGESGTLQLTPAAEVYSLGCVLVRLLAARPFCAETTPAAIKEFHQNGARPTLEKYDLSEDLRSLVLRMMAIDPAQRPTIGEAANLLSLYSGHADEFSKPIEDSARAAYEKTIQIHSEDDRGVVPAIDLGGDRPASETTLLAAEERIRTAREKAEQRKKQKWQVPAIILGSLFGLLMAISGVIYFVTPPIAPIAESSQGVEGIQGSPSAKNGGTANEQGTKVVDASAVAVTQTLVADDEMLWETPTVGMPVSFDYLPTAPKLLLHLRPSDIVADVEGQRILQGFGPKLEETLVEFKQRSGFELKDIERLVLSFHDADEGSQFETYAIVTLKQPIDRTRVLELWKQPTVAKTESGADYLISTSGTAFLEIQSNVSAPGAGVLSVRQFAIGTETHVAEVADLPGGVPLAGSLKSVAKWTDRDRHLNFLFLRPSLFNDRGQTWMGKPLAAFNRELSVLIPDGVQGAMVGFHIDNGNYLELRFDRIADLKARDLKEKFEAELRSRRDQLTGFVAKIQPNPFWDRVRVKYPGMLTDVARNFRWGIEGGEVVGNCWLSPMAAHNLIAASELVSSFAAGSGAVVADPNQLDVPATLVALLMAKRDLEIANPPDLNVLMADLKSEIDSDYGKLPFAWDIRLLGGDLEKEGITKNQRPGELIMKQKTLGEILTLIMISANPDKNITGASDPNCKMVWVVAADPDQPEQKSILITTRAAAAEKSYTLPEPFRVQ